MTKEVEINKLKERQQDLDMSSYSLGALAHQEANSKPYYKRLSRNKQSKVWPKWQPNPNSRWPKGLPVHQQPPKGKDKAKAKDRPKDHPVGHQEDQVMFLDRLLSNLEEGHLEGRPLDRQAGLSHQEDLQALQQLYQDFRPRTEEEMGL